MEQFIFSEKAQTYIREKGGIAHLILYRRSSMCCGKVALPPMIQLGIPKNQEDYISEDVEGIQFFYPKSERFHHSLTIDLHKTLGISSLQVENWKMF